VNFDFTPFTLILGSDILLDTAETRNAGLLEEAGALVRAYALKVEFGLLTRETGE
jgi:hypothetical protein